MPDQSPVLLTPRVIRVFVPSTFRDMKEERDHLVKFVFPQLRNLCEHRGVVGGEVEHGVITYQARLCVLPTGGTRVRDGDRIGVQGADSALLLLAAATNFRNFRDVSGDPEAIAVEQLSKAARKDYVGLRNAHVQEHQRLFNRVSLTLPKPESIDLPTEQRLTNMGKGRDDPALAALLFQFGRYLLISSSRPGTQPPNLQGIWCGDANPAWDSKYTTNINLQMN